MGRTRSVRDRAAMYREREPKGVAPSYTITVTWPRGRVQQVHRKTKDQAREIAEAIELKGARVKVIEWRGSQFQQLADLDAFAKRPSLPPGATHADKVVAIKADLARLAEQATGRWALQ